MASAINNPTIATEPSHKKRRSNQEEDRISQLPDEILHSILSLLSLKESAITTALSKRWARLFPTLPHLCFENNLLCLSTEEYPWNSDFEIVPWLDAVRDVLETRIAPLKSCSISSKFFDQFEWNFDGILIFLCKDGIQNLSLWNSGRDHYSLPKCLYACRTVKTLELYQCDLSVPKSFTALRRLQTLHIEECIARDEEIERMVSCCRAMEKLSFSNNYTTKKLMITAHKLRVLEIAAHRPLEIQILKAPLLESVTMQFDYNTPQLFLWNPDDSDYWGETDDDDDQDDNMDRSEVSRFLRFLEGIGNIQNLSFYFATRYLSKMTDQGMRMPKALPVEHHLHKLKKLTLKTQLDSKYFLSTLSCLLNSSPRLEELVIGDSCVADYCDYSNDAVADYWSEQIGSDCLNNHLTSVTAYPRSKFSSYWVEFIEFLLTNACVLRKMVVNYNHCKEGDTFEDFQQHLSLLHVASPIAVVEMKSAPRGMPEL